MLLAPGFDGAISLRFPPEYADEVKLLLDEVGLSHSTAGEFSAGVELAIESVKVIGALGAGGSAFALASFYKTFAHRHDGKRVVIKAGEIDVSGYSPRQLEKLIENDVIQQAARDAAWQATLDSLDAEEAGRAPSDGRGSAPKEE